MTEIRTMRPRTAFTLVELLVVVTIIALLAGLLIPAGFGAVKRARQNAVATDLVQLSSAIEAYKTKRGDYPPDFSSVLAIQNHMTKSYSNAKATYQAVLARFSPPSNLPSQAQHLGQLDPAEALVFWLSLSSSNPRDPFDSKGERQVYFEFDQTRLGDADDDGWKEYYPKYTKGMPFVYFDGRIQTIDTAPTSAFAFTAYPIDLLKPAGSRNAAITRNDLSSIPVVTGNASVRPYRSSTDIPSATDPTFPSHLYPSSAQNPLNGTTWISPGKFQIVSPGLDGLYAADDVDSSSRVVFKRFPVPQGNFPILKDDRDNLTNFTEGKTIEDSVP